MRALTLDTSDAIPARSAGLTYVLDDAPGIRRERRGPGFSYRDPAGAPVEDPETLDRIRKLAIPPAWTQVWICPDPRGHVQATGRDVKGRKQYKYHDGWRALRDATKFDHVLDFARRLPRIRTRISADMRRHTNDRRKVCATVVSLLDITLARVGNDEYAEVNGSYGLTTLKNRHIKVEGEELRFHFKGKSGRIWKLAMRHRRIARIVRTIQDLPGQRLFQYRDADGELKEVTSSDVNAYLQEIAGPDITAKDFRTWAGTVLAAAALSEVGPFASEREAKSKIKLAIGIVAERLGNTPTVCRQSYVHPEIIACYRAGLLPRVEAPAPAGPRTGLSPDEQAVLRLLGRRLRPKRQRRDASPSASP